MPALKSSENWRRRRVPVITSSRRTAVAPGLSVWSSVDTSRSPIQRSHNRPSSTSDEGGITTAVTMILPVAKRGRPRQRHDPDTLSIPAEDILAKANCTPSSGAPARKESLRLVLRRSACGSPTDRRSGSGTRASNICPGTRLGSSASTGCQERRNTISPTCQWRLTCAPWRPPSRHAGFASRLTSS
jgi:hypothetical protein